MVTCVPGVHSEPRNETRGKKSEVRRRAEKSENRTHYIPPLHGRLRLLHLQSTRRELELHTQSWKKKESERGFQLLEFFFSVGGAELS